MVSLTEDYLSLSVIFPEQEMDTDRKKKKTISTQAKSKLRFHFRYTNFSAGVLPKFITKNKNKEAFMTTLFHSLDEPNGIKRPLNREQYSQNNKEKGESQHKSRLTIKSMAKAKWEDHELNVSQALATECTDTRANNPH